MGFDRALSKAALDTALDAAAAGATKAELAERLVPVVGEKEATGRTRAHVARVWLDPPAHARRLIGWAVEHHQNEPERMVLHHVALLATTPVLVPIAILGGRQLKSSGGRLDVAKLTRGLAKSLGTDRTATQGIANGLATFRSIGLLLGTEEAPFGTQPPVPKALAGWCVHALLVIRRALDVDAEAWRDAEELGLLGRRPSGGILGYPLLDLRGAGGRTIASERE